MGKDQTARAGALRPFNQLDVWRAADIRVHRYKEGALEVVAGRSQMLLDAGNLERYETSRRRRHLLPTVRRAEAACLVL